MDNLYCCWNIKNVPWEGHNDDCLKAYGPQYRNAKLAVTFMDGQTIIYHNVRVCINNPQAGDGIRVIGDTTLSFEAADGVGFTVLGVRQYVYSITDER